MFGEPNKKPFFQSENLFFAIYSEEEAVLLIRIRFGEKRDETKNKIISKVLQKKIEKMVNIKELSNEHLRLQIKEILQKKKEKMLAFAKGVNRVELNKTIKKVTPEEILTKRVFYFFYEKNKNFI